MKKLDKSIKKDFPVFRHHPNMAYLDSTATALKPQKVIDKIQEYYEQYPANIFRGIYSTSERATEEFEKTREKVTSFFHASTSNEIVFTRNSTESLNLLASSLLPTLQKGDEVVTTLMEHHSNFVPWQQLCARYGITLKLIPIESDGTISKKTIREYITPKTKIFSFVHISNVLGTINPADEFIRIAKSLSPDIITIVDAAQSASHLPIDVDSMDCDFLVASSHKMLGPTGVGILWGKYDRLDQLSPYQYGGEMVEYVTSEKTLFKKPPHKFEAGTPAIGEVIGLGAAIDYLNEIGFGAIRNHDRQITEYATDQLQKAFGDDLHILGPADINKRSSILAFTLKGIHPHDLAQILADQDIAVRAGTHCAMPLHQSLHIEYLASTRASFHLYNTSADVDRLVAGIQKARALFQ